MDELLVCLKEEEEEEDIEVEDFWTNVLLEEEEKVMLGKLRKSFFPCGQRAMTSGLLRGQVHTV